jgi:hypothetical protein
LHEITVENLFNASAVQVAQHVGVASTTGFDIALGIDMQSAPGGCTVKIRHPVFTGLILRWYLLYRTIGITMSIVSVVFR